MFATRPDRALDRRFLALALRSSPQLRTGRVAIAEDEGDLRGLLATGGSPILGAEIRPQQLETLGPLSLVPVTAYYEDDAFSGLQGFAFWRHVLRGGGPAGRVHLRAGPALQQHEAGSAEALELHFAAAETEDTGSLRSWMRALPGDLEASRLIAAIEDRGGQVVRGKQEGNGAAADLLPNWCWRFLPELARRSPERRDLGERAARVSHLLPESAQRPLEDPEFDPLLAELLRRIDHP